ncbi:tyrosine-type recombinase/integrase [Patescibacteria group bacterium]|nr:tyrosine-type recombinase/integrase [Patescibacteria group bacterium]MBU4458746.1 tyrosine-type recombinase/integrase [Patescibacteria group bacterium]MCG2696047.1 tyrosine-type recombinase/integrase [Candidatus Portnoybacteria bacterium]
MEKNITLPYFDDFLLNLQTNNLSQETLYNYERDLNVFQDFLSEINTEFKNINKKTILNYKAYLTSIDRKTAEHQHGEKKLSSYSINRMLSVLRSYVKYLIDMDYNSPIAPESIKLLKTEKKHPRVSEFEEIKKLIESPTQLEKNKIIGLRNRAMLELLFSTGMRISELLNFKQEQIDKNGRIFILGKGKKERFVYLTHRAQKHLGEYLKERMDDSSFVFIPFSGSNMDEKNRRITPSYLQRKIKEYRELLGINIPLSAHSIRHGFATYLAEQGANPAAIQILLGHESLNTTTRYVHASDRYAQKTHQKFHPLKE